MLALASLATVDAAAPPGPRAEIRRGAVILAALTLEVADDPLERQRGLMGRSTLPDDHGMLFVFESDGRWSFWMRDTPTPLAIAFARADGRIVDIQEMRANDETLHVPPEPIRLALEVASGYFDRRGIRVGDDLRALLPRVRFPVALRYHPIGDAGGGQ